jgi:hypothetical protein
MDDRDGRKAECAVLPPLAIQLGVVWPKAARPLRRRSVGKADRLQPTQDSRSDDCRRFAEAAIRKSSGNFGSGWISAGPLWGGKAWKRTSCLLPLTTKAMEKRRNVGRIIPFGVTRLRPASFTGVGLFLPQTSFDDVL